MNSRRQTDTQGYVAARGCPPGDRRLSDAGEPKEVGIFTHNALFGPQKAIPGPVGRDPGTLKGPLEHGPGPVGVPEVSADGPRGVAGLSVAFSGLPEEPGGSLNRPGGDRAAAVERAVMQYLKRRRGKAPSGPKRAALCRNVCRQGQKEATFREFPQDTRILVGRSGAGAVQEGPSGARPGPRGSSRCPDVAAPGRPAVAPLGCRRLATALPQPGQGQAQDHARQSGAGADVAGANVAQGQNDSGDGCRKADPPSPPNPRRQVSDGGRELENPVSEIA